MQASLSQASKASTANTVMFTSMFVHTHAPYHSTKIAGYDGLLPFLLFLLALLQRVLHVSTGVSHTVQRLQVQCCCCSPGGLMGHIAKEVGYMFVFSNSRVVKRQTYERGCCVCLYLIHRFEKLIFSCNGFSQYFVLCGGHWCCFTDIGDSGFS